MADTTRVYGEGDLTDFVDTETPPGTDSPPFVLFITPVISGVDFSKSMSANELQSVNDPNSFCELAVAKNGGGAMVHTITAQLNFATPPNIPLNAEVHRVRYSFDYTISFTISSTYLAGGNQIADVSTPHRDFFPVGVTFKIACGGDGGLFSTLFEQAIPSQRDTVACDGTQATMANVITGTFTNELDFGAITYADLVTFFSVQTVELSAFADAHGERCGVDSGAVLNNALAFEVSITNWEFQVDYIDGGGGPPIIDVIGDGGVIIGDALGGGNASAVYGISIGGTSSGIRLGNFGGGPSAVPFAGAPPTSPIDGGPYSPVPTNCAECEIDPAVRQAFFDAGDFAPLAIAYPAPVVAGSMLVVQALINTDASVTVSCADDQGQTWTLAVEDLISDLADSFRWVTWWVPVSSAAGALTVTISASDVAEIRAAFAYEVTGMAAPVLDDSNLLQLGSIGPGVDPAVAPLAPLVTAEAAFVIAGGWIVAGEESFTYVDPSWEDGFVDVGGANGTNLYRGGSRIVLVASSVSPAISILRGFPVEFGPADYAQTVAFTPQCP